MKSIYVNDLEFINSITTVKVDTPDGIQEVGDTIIKEEQCSILTTNNTRIEVANNHIFLGDKWIKLEDINIGDTLKSRNGEDIVLHIIPTSKKKVYDFEVLHENHRYYSNGLISHNTGKTILSLMAALACTKGRSTFRYYDQILVTKPPVSVNKNMYTGFKPGSSEEKMSGHLGGIKSNLKFLLNKKEKKKELKLGEEPEATEADKAWLKYFGVIEIDEIQGTSLHDTILLVDEWQLLSEEDAKLVLSRIAEGSKVVLIGDTIGQTYGMNRANEGFKVVYKYLGEAPEFNYIRLSTIYRSKLARLVAEMFED